MTAAAQTHYISGIVEGFYGRQWSWQARTAYADYLVSQGLNSYLYCPKGDAYLRKQWQSCWPAQTRDQLQKLARHYRGRSLNWGVGLSPYALYQNYGTKEKHRLREKIAEVDALGGSLLAVLFDDMPGDCPDLAQRQAEILRDIADWSEAQILLTCPTYYSFDPVLERFFGQRPPRYWEQFGAEIPSEYGIFWCGNQVCSESISGEDVEAISALLGRAPVLWDNYPVNDGAKASNFLHIAPLARRDTALQRVTVGHLCNPMNQAYLSMAPLTGMAVLLGGEELAEEGARQLLSQGAARELLGDELAGALVEDLDCFQLAGLAALEPEAVQRLQKKYRQIDHPAATEIVDWLSGEYVFDPACLTG